MTAQFLASIYTKMNWLQWFLHHTAIGRRLFTSIWDNINAKAWAEADYDRADGKSNGLYNLKPDTPLFWQNDSTSINQRPDFFDVIATKVKVYREDVYEMTDRAVLLGNGKRIETDAVIYAIGWQTSSSVSYSCDIQCRLGLPVSRAEADENSLKGWKPFDDKADEEVRSKFPSLQNPPEWKFHDPGMTPFRLFRGILPLEEPHKDLLGLERSIAFVGRVMLGNNFRAAEVQALWAIAALDGHLELPVSTHMKHEVSKAVMWSQRRYLSKGVLGNYYYYDLVPYTDILLEDLGLRSHLPRNRWKRLFKPCIAAELRSLIEEYQAKAKDN